MTIAEARTYGIEVLSRFPTAALDTDVLLQCVTRQDRSFLRAHDDIELSEFQEQDLMSYVTRRSKHEPVAYIVGEKEFYGRTFIVDQRVLIPRPETEILVETACRIIREEALTSMWDIGTGSGCIGITLALECPEVLVIGTDTSHDALKVAKLNCNHHRVNTHVKLVPGMMPVDAPMPDMITANLPYLNADEMSSLAPDISAYESVGALDGGADGFDIYRALFQTISDREEVPHALCIEISPSQREIVAREIPRAFPDAHLEIIPDLAGLSRVVLVRW